MVWLHFLANFDLWNSDFLSKVKELGGWPVLEGEQWDSNSFNWIKVLVNMREMGFQINFPVEAKVDYMRTESLNLITMPTVSFYSF